MSSYAIHACYELKKITLTTNTVMDYFESDDCEVIYTDVSISVPQTPKEIENCSNPAYIVHSKATITDIECKISIDYSDIKLNFTFCGTKTYDYYNSSNKFKLWFRLYDANNVLIKDSILTTVSVAEGETFEKSISVMIKAEKFCEGTYRVVLGGVNW